MNDLAFVLRAVDLLASHACPTWVSGGWGEELRGLIPPRTHVDVDLLYPARGWDRIDALELDWVEAKRFPWKRAFELDRTMVELFLVQRDEQGWYTQLQRRRHDWPANLFTHNGRLPVASTAALAGYRHAYNAAAAA